MFMGNVRSAIVYPAMAFLLFSLLCSDAAQANRKTDVLTLYNGDHITGEIKSLRDGLLSFGTNAMGTISVEWKEVASVASDYFYELRLSNGERLFGSIEHGDRPGAVTFEDARGRVAIEALDITEIRPIEAKGLDRMDIYLSANYNFTKASGVQQSEFNADIDYADENAITSLDSRLTLSATDTDSSASSRVSFGRKSWTENSRFFRNLSAGFESNDELGIEARYLVGLGVGRFLVDTNRQRFSAGVGLQALEERGADGKRRQSLEGVVGAQFATWRFDDPDLDLRLDAALYPSLTRSGRLRADSSARLRWEIVSDLFWNLNAWGSFDSSSVDEEAKGEFDWGVTTGLGWSF